MMSRHLAVALCLTVALAGCGGGGRPPPKPIVLERLLLVDEDLEPVAGPEATGVGRDVRIIFVFSGPVALATKDEAFRIEVVDAAGDRRAAEGSLSLLSGAGRRVLFDPTVLPDGEENYLGFPAGSRIEVRLPAYPQGPRVLGRDGRVPLLEAYSTWFETGSGLLPRLVTPEVVSTRPRDGETGVNPGADIVVEFHDPMDAASFVIGETVFVRNLSRNVDVAGSLLFSSDSRRVAFRPTGGFGKGPYQIFLRITREVRNLWGHGLPLELRIIFTTVDPMIDPGRGEVLESFVDNTYQDTDYEPSCGLALWNAAGSEGRCVVGDPCPDGVSSAQSRFYEMTVSSPQFLDPLISASQPEGTEIRFAWQGSSDGETPETEWLPSLRDMDGYRFVRFRVELRGNPDTGEYPSVDEVTIPYYFY